MRHRTLAPALLLGVALAACGGGTPGGGETPLPGIYVDAANGSDETGKGSFNSPYKTISRGHLDAGPGEVVRVRPGTYDAANGERFPIRPGIGVTIEGNRFERGRGTFVVGGALWSGDPSRDLNATIVPGPDCRIVGLRVHNPNRVGEFTVKPTAVVLAMSNVAVEACTIYESHVGIRLAGNASGCWIRGCDVLRNEWGILGDDDSTGTDNHLVDSRVMENLFGVDFAAGRLGLGGEDPPFVGNNTFALNQAVDLVALGAAENTYLAVGCFWDHAPPVFHVGTPLPVPGPDIWVLDAAQVVTTFAQPYQPDPADPVPGGGSIGP